MSRVKLVKSSTLSCSCPARICRAAKRYEPSLHHHKSDWLNLFAIYQLSDFIDVHQLHEDLMYRVKRLFPIISTMSMSETMSWRTYLVDSDFFATHKLDAAVCYARNTLIVNSKYLVLLGGEERFCTIVRYALGCLLFARFLSDYPMLVKGLSQYIAYGNTAWYEVIAHHQLFGLPSIVELTSTGKKKIHYLAFSCFLMEILDDKKLGDMIYFLKANRKRYLGCVVFVPELEWAMESVLGMPRDGLDFLWRQTLARLQMDLDQDVISNYIKRLQIYLLYKSGRYSECIDLCHAMLTSSSFVEEVVFVLASTYAALEDYRGAIEVLSRYASVLPHFLQGWTYLCIGRLYDVLQYHSVASEYYRMSVSSFDFQNVLSDMLKVPIHRTSSSIQSHILLPHQLYEELTNNCISAMFDTDFYLLKFEYSKK